MTPPPATPTSNYFTTSTCHLHSCLSPLHLPSVPINNPTANMSRLGPSAMVSRMASALPNHQKGDDGSDLASSYEVIALLIHSYLEAIGFRLVGFDEGKPLRTLPPGLPNSFRGSSC